LLLEVQIQKGDRSQIKRDTNGLNEIRRNILLLDIQERDIDVARCESIQIGIVIAMSETNSIFCGTTPKASQKHSRSKGVLKLETRSSFAS